MAHDQTPLRKQSGKSALVESYCSGCGMFIAASAKLEPLEIAEKRHRCPSLASFEHGLDVLRFKRRPITTELRSSPDTPGASALGDKLDYLLGELTRKESELDQWIRSSETNASWFLKDPVAAIRAAGLGIDEKILKELEAVTAAIAHKLKAGL